MAQYTCSKCGADAYSKCAQSRNVFMDDQLAAMVGNMFRYGKDAAFERTHVPTLVITLHGASYPIPKDGDPTPIPEGQREREERVAVEVLRDIGKMEYASLKRALCDHQWKLQDEKCQLGCCTR